MDNFETISEKKELLQENLKKIALEIFNDSQADFFKDIGARELSKIGDLRIMASQTIGMICKNLQNKIWAAI